jgi:hypothetical protein
MTKHTADSKIGKIQLLSNRLFLVFDPLKPRVLIV